MTFGTHTLVGLILGKVTGNFPAALAGSLVVDLDHTISYFRHGILFKPRKLLNTIENESDRWKDQRNFLHNIFGWATLSVLLILINLKIGLVFSVAHLLHLVLDASDSADFWPFFPFKKFDIKGPLKYFSRQEIAFDVFLILILASLFIF